MLAFIRGRGRSGLTMLELILVMVLVAVLAVAAVPKIRMSNLNQMKPIAVDAFRQINSAVFKYESEYGNMPLDGNWLQALESKGFIKSSELPPNMGFCFHLHGTTVDFNGAVVPHSYYVGAGMPKSNYTKDNICTNDGWVDGSKTSCSFWTNIYVSGNAVGDSSQFVSHVSNCWDV